MYITDLELAELKQFKKRRRVFGGVLSVKNVHNVPSHFPNMYKRIFNTDNSENDLFCTNNPYYSDADEEVVRQYEALLNLISD